MTEPIPYFSFNKMHTDIQVKARDAFERVYNNGHFILGPEVEAFESEYAAYCGTKFAIGISNGLDALKIILRALDIGPGDEVVLPTNSFIATALAVTEVGAKPVLSDVDPKSYCLRPKYFMNKINACTKAVIGVHLYGQIPHLEELTQFCEEKKLFLIEDAAQAHGATYAQKKAGSFGVAGAFSFYPAKNLGALGDGGMITTSSAQLRDKICMLRNYGSTKKYHHPIAGTNSRLDELQAALLRVKLPYLEAWNEERRCIANYYLQHLNKKQFELPWIDPKSEPVWHIFSVLVDNRLEIQKKLNKVGVSTQIHYPVPIHLQGAYKNLNFSTGSFPISEQLAERCLSLPIYPGLDPKQVVDRINKSLY